MTAQPEGASRGKLVNGPVRARGLDQLRTRTHRHRAVLDADRRAPGRIGRRHPCARRVCRTTPHGGSRRAIAGRWRICEAAAGSRSTGRRHTVPPRQTALRRALVRSEHPRPRRLSPPRIRPDVVLTQMPSLAGGVLGGRLARQAGVPHVVIVQDLMGAAAEQSGIQGGGRVAALAGGWRPGCCAARPSSGWCTSRSWTASWRWGCRAHGCMWCPTGRMWRAERRPRADAGTAGLVRTKDTVVLHAGNMGLKQGLDVLVEAARLAGQEARPYGSS